MQTDCFMDPRTGEVIDPPWCDAEGTDPIGADQYGMWWGTKRAAWVISDARQLVAVTGHSLGSTPWDGWFVATVEEATDFMARRGVIVDLWEIVTAEDDWNR